jgi:hypothetical protein
MDVIVVSTLMPHHMFYNQCLLPLAEGDLKDFQSHVLVMIES